MLAEIIGNVFILIKVLKVPSEIEWISKDAKIDPTLMDVEGQIVNLYYFPLNLKSETDHKVIISAKKY